MGGAYAWHVFTKDQFGKCIPWEIEGVGREHVGKIIVGLTPAQRPLDTMEAHSYRMEALALLSGLVFMRVDIQWQGHITWYTDSQAVIDTGKKVTWYNMTCWVKQRDKDVWDALKQELNRWQDRLILIHVESHTDKKKNDDGTPRTVTEEEK